MKIKTTIIGKNSEHYDESASKEHIEKIAENTWKNILSLIGADLLDVEEIKCELLER